MSAGVADSSSFAFSPSFDVSVRQAGSTPAKVAARKTRQSVEITCTWGDWAIPLKKARLRKRSDLMNVFVYGTLLVPKIWNAVTQTPELESFPATLAGHVIRRVRDAAYPGIYRNPDAPDPVPGKVFLDVPASALRRLDAYEDAFYERNEVHPDIAGVGCVPAQVYLIRKEDVPMFLSEEPWTLAWFERHELDEFWQRVFSA